MKPSMIPQSAFQIYVATDADVPGKSGATTEQISTFNAMPRGAFVFVQDDPTLLYFKGRDATYASGNRIEPVSTGTGGFVPPDDNLTDLGDSTHRFKTLYLGTSIANAGDMTISLSGAASRTLTLENPTPGWTASLYTDGNVRADGGATFGTAITPLATNTVDVGITGNRFRTLYLGKSIIAPLWQYTTDAGIELNAGATTNLTIRNTDPGQVCNVYFDGNLIPDVDAAQTCGASPRQWSNVYTVNLTASGRGTISGGVVPFKGTVAEVNALAAPASGLIAYATNGRCIGEGPRAGTGTITWYNGANWVIADGTTLAA